MSSTQDFGGGEVPTGSCRGGRFRCRRHPRRQANGRRRSRPATSVPAPPDAVRLEPQKLAEGLWSVPVNQATRRSRGVPGLIVAVEAANEAPVDLASRHPKIIRQADSLNRHHAPASDHSAACGPIGRRPTVMTGWQHPVLPGGGGRAPDDRPDRLQKSGRNPRSKGSRARLSRMAPQDGHLTRGTCTSGHDGLFPRERVIEADSHKRQTPRQTAARDDEHGAVVRRGRTKRLEIDTLLPSHDRFRLMRAEGVEALGAMQRFIARRSTAGNRTTVTSRQRGRIRDRRRLKRARCSGRRQRVLDRGRSRACGIRSATPLRTSAPSDFSPARRQFAGFHRSPTPVPSVDAEVIDGPRGW